MSLISFIFSISVTNIFGCFFCALFLGITICLNPILSKSEIILSMLGTFFISPVRLTSPIKAMSLLIGILDTAESIAATIPKPIYVSLTLIPLLVWI